MKNKTDLAMQVVEKHQESPDEDTASWRIMTDDEKIEIAAARILKKYKPAFEELAK